MKQKEQVHAIKELYKQGYGCKKIADLLGFSRNTVRKYVRQGKWLPYNKSNRVKVLDPYQKWIEKLFAQHRCNAVVVHQEFLKKIDKAVSLRSVQRAVQGIRAQLKALSKATVRFETPPGKQLQIDFCSTTVLIGEKPTRVFLFVAVLGFSRRLFVTAFKHERQTSWLRGLEGAFYHFGGVPKEVLFDNAKALVVSHQLNPHKVTFTNKLEAFARYWGFNLKACAPYRPETKGKGERAVRYIKENAIAGHSFTSWEALEAHLTSWTREVADLRIHGTTGEKPLTLFNSQEAQELKAVEGRPPFLQIRELKCKVYSDSCVIIDKNRYSVPMPLIGKEVIAHVEGGTVKLFCDNQEVARHLEHSGVGEKSLRREHIKEITAPKQTIEKISELQRPLSEYEAVVGGVSWRS